MIYKEKYSNNMFVSKECKRDDNKKKEKKKGGKREVIKWCASILNYVVGNVRILWREKLLNYVEEKTVMKKCIKKTNK